MDETALRARIKKVLVQGLGLHGLEPDAIGDDGSLQESFGLDSVDALELVLGLEQEFDVKIQGKGLDRETFSSVASLARFVRARREERQHTPQDISPS